MAIKCVVVTPEKTELEQDADMVVVPMQDGEAGYQSNAAPIIGRLGCGEMRLLDGEKVVERCYVERGFVQIADNTISVITNRMVKAADIDLAAVQNELKELMAQEAGSAAEQAIRENAMEVARSQIRVAESAK